MASVISSISVLDTTPCNYNMFESKVNLPTVNQIADDYNNPYFGSINYQTIMVGKALDVIKSICS